MSDLLANYARRTGHLQASLWIARRWLRVEIEDGITREGIENLVAFLDRSLLEDTGLAAAAPASPPPTESGPCPF